MSNNAINALRSQLSREERSALDDPDRLFALSYLIGHIDLLSTREEIHSPIIDLKAQVEHSFASDRLSPADCELIRAELARLN